MQQSRTDKCNQITDSCDQYIWNEYCNFHKSQNQSSVKTQQCQQNPILMELQHFDAVPIMLCWCMVSEPHRGSPHTYMVCTSHILTKLSLLELMRQLSPGRNAQRRWSVCDHIKSWNSYSHCSHSIPWWKGCMKRSLFNCHMSIHTDASASGKMRVPKIRLT